MEKKRKANVDPCKDDAGRIFGTNNTLVPEEALVEIKKAQIEKDQ